MTKRPLAVLTLAIAAFSCGDGSYSILDETSAGPESEGAESEDPDASEAPRGDAGTETDDAGPTPIPSPCPPAPANPRLTLAADAKYAAAHLKDNPPHEPLGRICLPVTAAGQSFYLEAKVIRADCTAYDACETSLEIKCFDESGTQLRPQVWSGENFLREARSSKLFTRMMFRASKVGAVTCRAQFFNHDHGVAGGTITVKSGSTFSMKGPLVGASATSDTGGAVRLSSARTSAALKPISKWKMPPGLNSADYIGDIQVTECHSKYPSTASNPATQCTAPESGPDSVVEYRAEAYEENADGTTCHVTEGASTTVTVLPRIHHKMLYTQVIAPHTPGCANVWHFQVATFFRGGRSFMVGPGPYGQGLAQGR